MNPAGVFFSVPLSMAEHDHVKRVSFGSSADVRLIVYDDPQGMTYTFHAKQEPEIQRVTTPDRVLVKQAVEEEPRPISPPAQFPPPLHNGNGYLPERRMDTEGDNPFRPQESLYNEVDPIVEAYKTRPFPPSPSGSPVPPDLTPIKNGKHVTLECGVTHSDAQPLFHNNGQQRNGAKHENGFGNAVGDVPPPNSVELVHLDGKPKKCHCCTLQ